MIVSPRQTSIDPLMFLPRDFMPSHQSRLIWLLILAVLAWGIYHAIGAYLLNHNPYRALVVMVCVGGYLAFWMLLLRRRASRVGRR